MNNATATLKSTTAITPPLKQDINLDKPGMVDLVQLVANIYADPQTVSDPQTVRSLEARLTPVQRGELARLRDAAAAVADKSATATPTINPLALTQEKLTPVQQGEQARALDTRVPAETTTPAQGGSQGDRVLLQEKPFESPTFRPITIDGVTAEPERRGFWGVVTGIADVVIGGVLPPFVPSPIQTVTDLFGNGSAGSAAVSIAKGIEAAYKAAPEILNLLSPGQQAEDFLKVAGTGTEWGEHLFNLATNPAAQVGFQKGLALGVWDGVVDLAKSAGEFLQDAGDLSRLGAFGDTLRDWDVTGNFAPVLDEIVPSNVRGHETINKAIQGVDKLGQYVQSRSEDPRLLRDDIRNYMKDNWDKLKGDWQTAHDKGPAAEGEFFGKIVGRAAFDIAVEFIPGKAVLTVLKAADKFIDVIQNIDNLPTNQRLPTINKAADEWIASADRITKSGYANPQEIEKLDIVLEELDKIDAGDFDKNTGDYAAFVEKKKDVIEAVADAKRSIATPRPKGPQQGIPDPSVTLNNNEQGYLNALPNIGSYTQHQGTAFATNTIARLTRATGNEFAVFRNAANQVYLVRGDAHGIQLTDPFKQQLKNQGYKLELHSQTGYSLNELEASYEDQQLLRYLGQNQSTIVNSNGDRSQFDQNNTIFGVGKNIQNVVNFTPDQFDDLANNLDLAPNTSYIVRDNNALTTDGSNFTEYTYTTDSRGDLVRIEGQLKRVTNRPNPRPNAGLQTEIGNQGVQADNPNLPANQWDVGFHILGDQFGGGINYANVTPGNKKLNAGTRGGWGYLENKLSEILRDAPNTDIQFSIEIERPPGPRDDRPSHFVFRHTINGGPEFVDRYENTLPIPGVTGQPLNP